MTKYAKFFEFAGWVGMILILSAYTLVTFQFLSPQSITFLVMNVIGAIAIAAHEGSQRDYAPTILNIFWALVAIVALLRLLFI